MRIGFAVLATSALVAGATVALERDASACGGCFQPQENPTVVTDHRMLLSVSKDQSTLYDQIKYSGSPSSFGWVLPIAGTVDVGLSADIAFEAIDQLTQTRILPPPQNCPPAPQSCVRNATPSASDSTGSGGSGGVDVLKQEVVGPYATVQLASSDPKALDAWLSQNGFVVPPDVEPIIAQYVGEHFDFLALKLIPGATVQNMRPVRVTTHGASATLPLRMVSAGTGATVGISLWIIGEGRYEPQNFPFFHIETADIGWDWTANKSNYTDLRAQKEAAGGGKIWEIESSSVLLPQDIQNQLYRGYAPGQGGSAADQSAAQDYDPVKGTDGSITKTASQVRDEDFATMFHGIATAQTRVTRVRSDVAHAALNADLVLVASSDQSELSSTRQLTKELNEPLCPIYQGCDVVGTAPRSQAQGKVGPDGETASCDTTATRSATRTSDITLMSGAGALLALAMVRARRRAKR